MPKSFTTAINNLNPKAQLIQSRTSLAKFLEAVDTLPLFRLSLLLIWLLGTISPKIKSEMLLPFSDNAASIRLLMIEGTYSLLALNVLGDNNNPSSFAFHQEAKQFLLPFNLQKQNKPRAETDPGGSASEAKLHS